LVSVTYSFFLPFLVSCVSNLIVLSGLVCVSLLSNFYFIVDLDVYLLGTVITTRNLVTCQGFFDRGIYPWERNAFCQGFTPGKVETRAFDILMICQGYNPWETRRRENNIVEREKI
jgi:hypothetical protein